MIIGIRREDKNEWERRTPLTPDDCAALIGEHHLALHLQPSTIRAFPDKDYAAVGAEIREDLSACGLILGVKEMPRDFFRPGGAYMFFSHVIKGQPYNMPMLRRLLELGTTLFDYELVADQSGRRLLFFGRFAGLAGMIDTLQALGKRLGVEGVPSPLSDVHMAHTYANLRSAREQIGEIGRRIARDGLDERIVPLVVGFAGYGNVSRGAQEILGLLPVQEITPGELPALRERRDLSRHHVYKVVFKEEHMVAPRDAAASFVLQDYYDHPENYVGTFDRHTPHLDVLVNCIFWTERYPRLLTKSFAAELFGGSQPPHLRVIGDISCDIEGSIELTVKVTDPAHPCYVYEPISGKVRDGYAGKGPVVMAVDNLPCELPIESSGYFGGVLRGYVAELAGADLSVPFGELRLAEPLKRSIIAHRGALRPQFAALEEAMRAAGA